MSSLDLFLVLIMLSENSEFMLEEEDNEDGGDDDDDVDDIDDDEDEVLNWSPPSLLL